MINKINNNNIIIKKPFILYKNLLFLKKNILSNVIKLTYCYHFFQLESLFKLNYTVVSLLNILKKSKL